MRALGHMVVFQDAPTCCRIERTYVSSDRLTSCVTERVVASSSSVNNDVLIGSARSTRTSNVWQRMRPISIAMLRRRIRERHHKAVKDG